MKEVKSKYNIANRGFRLGRRSRRTFLNNQGKVSVRKIQNLIANSTEDQLHEKTRTLLFDYWNVMKIFVDTGLLSLLTARDYMKFRLSYIDQPWLDLGDAYRSPEMMQRFYQHELALGDNQSDEFGSAQQ